MKPEDLSDEDVRSGRKTSWVPRVLVLSTLLAVVLIGYLALSS